MSLRSPGHAPPTREYEQSSAANVMLLEHFIDI
jgi:hypothetical protein